MCMSNTLHVDCVTGGGGLYICIREMDGKCSSFFRLGGAIIQSSFAQLLHITRIHVHSLALASSRVRVAPSTISPASLSWSYMTSLDVCVCV